MEFKAEIEKFWSLKKGMKVTLYIDEKNTPIFLKHINNFKDKPLITDIRVDEKKQGEILKRISPEQRAHIFAIYNDIADSSGDSKENVRHNLEIRFIEENPYSEFSLSDCSKELASDLIEWLIKFCFEQGIPLRESPKDMFDDVDRYLCLCIKKKICCICGNPATIHHIDAIGMGRDRRTVDDSDLKKIALCWNPHHQEAEIIGKDTFCEKYHVKGVLYSE